MDEFRPVLLKSAGYIYESALPLTPHGTSLFQKYSRLVGIIPSVHGAYQNWEPHRTIEFRSSAVHSAAWSPDGTKVVAGTENHDISICNAADGSFIGEVLLGHDDAVLTVAFSPDGNTIASGSEDCTICIWDAHSHVLLHRVWVDYEIPVYSVAFSPDGSQLASGSGGIYIWNVNDGSCALRFAAAKNIFPVAYSPDGRRLVSGSTSGVVRIWDAVNGVPIGEPFVGHDEGVLSVSFSPDGERIMSGSVDKTVRVWNTTDRTPAVTPVIINVHEVYTVAFSPDGTKIVAGCNGGLIYICDAVTGTLIRGLRQHSSATSAVAFSPNGKQMLSASSDSSLRIWSVVDNDLSGERGTGHSDYVQSAAFSPDGSRVATGSDDKTICIWNPIDGALLGTLVGHSGIIYGVVFSPDGSKLASASADNTIRIWRIEKNLKSDFDLALEGHTGGVWAVEFSPDGTRLVSVSEDTTVRIWKVADGTPIGEPLEGLAKYSPVIAFSPDGTKFISADKENTIRLWNATDSSLAGQLRGHWQTVSGAAFSADGTQIISQSLDFTIRLWDVANQSLISTFSQGHFQSWRGTALTSSSENEIPESITTLHDLLSARSGILISGGWIRIPRFAKRLWVPPRYRGQRLMVNGERVCICTATGHVVFVEMRD